MTMTARQSSATDRAIKLMRKGLSVTQAAAKADCNASTIYRACARAGIVLEAGKIKVQQERSK